MSALDQKRTSLNVSVMSASLIGPVRVKRFSGYNLAQILFKIRGLELHDWFAEFRTSCNLTSERLLLLLFKACIQKTENEVLAKDHFESLLAKMRRDRG